jgi:hypothetical protein
MTIKVGDLITIEINKSDTSGWVQTIVLTDQFSARKNSHDKSTSLEGLT